MMEELDPSIREGGRSESTGRGLMAGLDGSRRPSAASFLIRLGRRKTTERVDGSHRTYHADFTGADASSTAVVSGGKRADFIGNSVCDDRL